MKYALLVHETPELAERRKDPAFPAAGKAYGEALQAAGIFIGGAGLESSETRRPFQFEAENGRYKTAHIPRRRSFSPASPSLTCRTWMPRWNGPRAIRLRLSHRLKSVPWRDHILQWERQSRPEDRVQAIPGLSNNNKQVFMNTVDRLAYYFTRRQFGKVITPLKVHSARLPAAFGFFYAKIGKLDKKLTLSPEFVLLIREQVARINVCEFCMDIARAFTIQASMNQAKSDSLGDYRTSSLFTEAEHAALDYVTELTKEKKVNPDTFARLARHFSEREICEIVWLVATEHVYNMTNIGLNIHSDGLCDIRKRN